jgi:hypothetical protein
MRVQNKYKNKQAHKKVEIKALPNLLIIRKGEQVNNFSRQQNMSTNNRFRSLQIPLRDNPNRAPPKPAALHLGIVVIDKELPKMFDLEPRPLPNAASVLLARLQQLPHGDLMHRRFTSSHGPAAHLF